MDYIRFKLSKEEQALEYELRLKFYEFGRRFINDCCCNDEVSHLFRNNTSDREIIYSIKVQPYKSVGYDLEHEGDFINLIGDYRDLMYLLNEFIKTKENKPNLTFKQIFESKREKTPKIIIEHIKN